ncbi:MAG: EscU/YscU/HrcU family type III secretion system export apparatus switch protein [Planctomycetes bacterium]|nr:EscU/YscU/HrcU family type III secretion system export apparatus switch protein [Planctomycetota bacterium]
MPTENSNRDTSKTDTVTARQLAVALEFVAEFDNAPRVIARGFGRVAQQIIEKAQESNIEIVRDKDLALALSRIEINIEIPPELYEAVAQVLSYVYTINEKQRKKALAKSRSAESSEDARARKLAIQGAITKIPRQKHKENQLPAVDPE